MSRTRYLQNHLEPVVLDESNLRQTRSRLSQAILDSISLVEASTDRGLVPDQSIYVGNAGISAMYLRLQSQAPALSIEKGRIPNFLQLADRQVGLPNVPRSRDVRCGCISVVDSAAGIATVRLIRSLQHESMLLDITTLERAVEALDRDTTRTNELLYGKAGLLFALLQLRDSFGADNSNERLVNLTSDRIIGSIVDAIIREGTSAASSQECPLYFEWQGNCYLGAMHGLAGILTVLLQCPSEFIDDHRSAIIKSIDYLVRVVENDGVLPSSLPVTRHCSHPLVQICHGSPGILLLLATLDRTHPDWLAEIDNVQEAVSLASDVVWEQGILVKGISICHGVSGNAWPWLLMAHSSTRLTPDHGKTALSRALAFLLHATEMPPMSRRDRSPYRMPDNPCSLFEGLAGAICSWSEACVVISSMLGENPETSLLGVPCIGGLGTTGLL